MKRMQHAEVVRKKWFAGTNDLSVSVVREAELTENLRSIESRRLQQIAVRMADGDLTIPLTWESATWLAAALNAAIEQSRDLRRDHETDFLSEAHGRPDGRHRVDGTPVVNSRTRAPRTDLTRQQFGRLTVLRYTGGPQCAWTCRCDCGETKDVAGGSLRSGKTQSCGCLRREATSLRVRLSDMTGQRFGRLCVTGFVGMRAGESIWSCACDCGASIDVRGWSLRNGGTKSCGCLHRDRAREPRTDQPSYGAVHTRIVATRGSARLRDCVDCAGPAGSSGPS